MRIANYEVGSMGIGTAPLAFRGSELEAGIRIIRDALGAGVRLIDTARVYARADNSSYGEELVRLAIADLPAADRPLVMTKGGERREGEQFFLECSPEDLRRHLLASLTALGLDRIPLYALHKVDPDVPLEESVGALAEFQKEGLIEHIGLSNVTIEQIEVARAIAPITSVQNFLSVLDMSGLATARHCLDNGIAYLAYKPIAGKGGSVTEIPAIAEVAAAEGRSPQGVALAWLMAEVPGVIPLVGTTRSETILDSIAAAGRPLGAEAQARISAELASPPLADA